MNKLFTFLIALSLTVVVYSQNETTIYPTIPGTNIRDYNKPAVKADRDWDDLFMTLPGTDVRDYSTPSGVDISTNDSTTDLTMAIGIKCLRNYCELKFHPFYFNEIYGSTIKKCL